MWNRIKNFLRQGFISQQESNVSEKLIQQEPNPFEELIDTAKNNSSESPAELTERAKNKPSEPPATKNVELQDSTLPMIKRLKTKTFK